MPAAIAEADRAHPAGALGPRLEPPERGDHVLARLRLVERAEQLARLVLVAGIAAEREQRVGREGDEVLERQAAGDVLDVRVQPAVLVHDEHARQLAVGLGRPNEVAAASCRIPQATRTPRARP